MNNQCTLLNLCHSSGGLCEFKHEHVLYAATFLWRLPKQDGPCWQWVLIWATESLATRSETLFIGKINSGNGAEGSLEKNRRADCWVEDVVIVRRVDRGKFSEWWPRQAGGARRFSKPWRGQSMEIWDLSPFLPSKILLKYFRCENRN